MPQEIVIDIDTNGDVKLEGKGIDGQDCTALTKEIEAALGDVEKRTLKPEYRRARAVARKANA